MSAKYFYKTLDNSNRVAYTVISWEANHCPTHTELNHENQMNTQAKLAQIDAEITELQSKLAEAQDRRELLASVKPACDAALVAIDKVLDRLCLVGLSNEFGLKEIAAFKVAIDAKFKFMEDEEDECATQTEVKTPQVVKQSKRTQSCAKAETKDYQKLVFGDTSFPDRPVQSRQFKIIIQELTGIGIEIGKAIASRSDVKGWHLRWGQDKAGLYWAVGCGWGVEALKSGDELTGNWEGFDLDQQLECNGIAIDDID